MAHMFQEFEGTPEQIELVKKLTASVYDNLADTRLIQRGGVSQGGNCDLISVSLVHSLRDKGFPAKYRYHDNGSAIHVHVGLGNDWVADAQWQQFLGLTLDPSEIARRKLLPEVIITQLSTLPDTLIGYGVTEENLPFWLNAHELRL